MYVFAEPVTEEEADRIQSVGDAAQKDFARTVVGVGKDDPEVQAAWQDLQDEVDEQVDEDKNAAPTTEAQGDEHASQEAEATEDASSEEVATENTKPSTSREASVGPLMGWTLTVRSKVNGEYVERPEKLDMRDDWKIEYHIQDIAESTRQKLYLALKERRRQLIGQDEEAVDRGLQHYRNLIQRYSDRGREWRKEQDKINEARGVQIYKPLGPGSDAVASVIEDSKEEALSTSPS